jgi:hypothetical protein
MTPLRQEFLSDSVISAGGLLPKAEMKRAMRPATCGVAIEVPEICFVAWKTGQEK